ncbi:MAG: TetR family transcriptional regulator [Alphaproteobacteria bacterium]|nr:TetR family transcriptional regulator [Alphaproteobacteria bacterium]MDE2041581.1 TetR family transcriptional regulator [Alphaproteobacteria bacterium]MDE2341120.1 TetR family transcriptional regulator [Alphaproteobacteria bacterium]
MTTTRKRLSPDESRAAALEAARALLIETGPQAVTLKAVAQRIGRTHANVLHHFGSALELQKALAARMVQDACEVTTNAITGARLGEVDHAIIVDNSFTAFGANGLWALATWMVLSGEREALGPMMEKLHQLTDTIADYEAREFTGAIRAEAVARDTLAVVLLALGDALLGKELTEALGLPRDTARSLALSRLKRSAQLVEQRESA